MIIRAIVVLALLAGLAHIVGTDRIRDTIHDDIAVVRTISDTVRDAWHDTHKEGTR